MKIRTSAIVFILLIFAAGGLAQLFLWNNETVAAQKLAKLQAKQDAETFKEITILKSESYRHFVYDYSYWDELVNFLKTKDKQWATENLNSGLDDFDATAMFVLDKQKNILYQAVKDTELKELFLLIDQKRIKTDVPEFIKFFKKTKNGSLVEFYGAPIQKSFDTKRETEPSGYLLVAKKIDAKYLNKIERLGRVKIAIEYGDVCHHLGEQITYSDIPLLDEHGWHIANLCIESDNSLSDTLNSYALSSLIIGCAIVLVLIVALLLFATKYISLPLRNISTALRDRNTEHIAKYLDGKNEYGEISTLIVDFFRTEDELEELNRTLKQKIEVEVEKNRQKEYMLYQQSKQAAMGQMLNNIAHQWRQPLNTVSITVGKLEYASKKDILQKEDLSNSIQKIKHLVTQMSDTIDDFRNFFKPNKTKKFFNIEKCIKNSTSILSDTYENLNIKISTICDPKLECFGFERELMQVLLVCFGNSKDAIEENKTENGKITIIGKQISDTKISITVSDNGGGTIDNIIDDIFNPFFTTKEDGKGSGIGLYMSKQIIEQGMGGAIYAQNINNGLCVTIEIPIGSR